MNKIFYEDIKDKLPVYFSAPTYVALKSQENTQVDKSTCNVASYGSSLSACIKCHKPISKMIYPSNG